MRRIGFIFLVFLLFTCFLYGQKQTITGTVIDSENKEPLIGVNVLLAEGVGTVTGYDGTFTLEVQPGVYSIRVSYVGFEPQTQRVDVTDQPVSLHFELVTVVLDEVRVVADVARSRETPVAFSNIQPKKLQEEIAAQDIPMLLNSTPGVYATPEGGGDGDAQVTIRGFSSRNVGVLLDGVPVNDMENGHVYWSNWFGLDAVTRSIQVQRGLGASKLALPSVGGTINIITRGLDARKEGSVKQEVGSDGYLQTSFGYSTGQTSRGWGISVAGSYKQGDGWVDQAWVKGFFYYLKLDKKLGKHIVSASVYGAPQKHGQRSYQLPIQFYDAEIARDLGVPEEDIETWPARGVRYNQHWGYLARTKNNPDAKSKPISERENQYHKPQITLKDFWKVSDRLYVSNIAYLSIGRGGGIREKGTITLDSLGQKSFQNVYNRNISEYSINTFYDPELHAATNYLRKLTNEHFWYGLLSTLSFDPTQDLSISGGIDLRSYKGTHYESVYDLLGGDYAVSDFTDENMDLSNPAEHMLYEGDKNNYYNVGLVRWGGLFLQAEYITSSLSSFINLTGAYSAYKRIDYFKLEPESEWKELPGWTIKGGANYNLTSRMNLFINAGYLSKAPRFNNVFDYDNTLFREILNEKVKAIEMGYSFKSQHVSFNMNGYYTVWQNKPVDVASRILVEISPGEFEEQSVNINGMDALHKGIEMDFILKITGWLDMEGLVSLGDWRWNSEDTVRIYDDNRQLVETQYFDAKGVHVGNSAQTQVAGQLRIEPFKGAYLKPKFTYFTNYYAEFDPITLDGSPDSYEWYTDETGKHGPPRDSWEIPGYLLIDLHAGYGFKIWNYRCQIRLNVLNVMNKKYIATAQNNDPYNYQTYNDFDAKSSAVFFGLGRRYNVSLQFLF